ncbi:MAG TPA: 1-(5-phosphoribosyl)-5-[(5-phosphoribosylamino)methylideneamino]imidazole-4-carboxamide isomerase [Polyangiaceae bacterium LLY-WYZ-14_1]|nr:1-(5-phosphoribosyl)-5-[(5-phosphoribosylamino)methylideneamino]imidazole-4-carboxamide isomerase [Polyangiaceae bacterium LLY-WYZ-14_1]
MGFRLLPAIDLLNGSVVRLRQGRYDEVTRYPFAPLELARRYHAAGARWLHLVDLDGAREGRPGNLPVIRRILAELPALSIQVGGGIRDEASAADWLDAGAARVVLGTAAVRRPELVGRISASRPGSVTVAVDARGGEVAVAGWTEGSGVTPEQLARDAESAGAAAVLFTAIERDGTGSGPDVEATVALQSELRIPVLASGGVAHLAHLEELVARGVRGAVVGRALLEGDVDLGQALQLESDDLGPPAGLSSTPRVG